MAEIGKFNHLTVVKFVDFGIYLDGGELGELLLPQKDVPVDIQVGDTLEVFIYADSKDLLICTTRRPVCEVDQFALMDCVETTDVGAFVDWGLEKDVLVPFNNQHKSMEAGKHYIVYTYVDPYSDRIVGSTKLDRHLGQSVPRYRREEQVNLLIAGKTDLGYKAIINHRHWGILYFNEVFTTLGYGETVQGYIKKIREDDKIDLSLQRPGKDKSAGLEERILKMLDDEGGFIAIGDKSDPQLIYRVFSVSKKAYKQTIGGLMKKGLIKIEPNGIRHTKTIK